MQLMYVDESGDPGAFIGGNTPYYILSGLVISQADWTSAFAGYKALRKRLYDDFHFSKRVELHGSDFISVRNIKEYRRFKKSQRMKILQIIIKSLPSIIPNAVIINVCLDKSSLSSCTDYQERAWTRLIQRYENYLQKSGGDLGVVIPDMTDDKSITGLMRKMRVINYIPSSNGASSTNQPIKNIIEDPFFRDSGQSAFVQLVDCVVTALRLKEYGKPMLNKKYSADRYFNFLEPLCLKKASKSDPLGIVRK